MSDDRAEGSFAFSIPVLLNFVDNNIVNLPIVVVSLGSAGALLLLITIILLVANRLRGM